MHFSKSQISRLGLPIVCVAIAALSACKPSTQLPNANANTNVSPTSTSSSTSLSTSQPSITATTTLAKGSAAEQFAAIVGTQQDGWLPKVLAGKGLKKGLTPAETGKIIPGADRVSEFSFSKVTVKDVPGLKRYEFYYAKGGSTPQLESVRLTFDPMLNQAYPDLVKVLSSKYGEAKPEDVKKQIIVWVNPDFLTAQLTKQVTDLGAYELNVSLEKE
jgi:hypothetical protein